MKRIVHLALLLSVALSASNSAEAGAPTPQSGTSQLVVEGDSEICENLDRHHTLYGSTVSDPTDAPDSSPGELYGCLSCHAVDTSSGENHFLIERECRACHSPDRHHVLYGSAIRYPTAAPYSTAVDLYVCLSCHEIEALSGTTHILVEREYEACHSARRVESVLVDIEPGSDLNRIEAESKGALPVAILDDTGYEVAEIDVSSLLLAGQVARARWRLEAAEDGSLDLILRFSGAAIAEALGGLQPGQSYGVSITGVFDDGIPFVGSDTLVVSSARRRGWSEER